MNIRAMVNISGIVQGVCFRQYTQQTALEMHVTGWVRNLPDGTVEACLEGEEPNVEKMILWCRSGPPRAQVTGVQVKREQFTGQFEAFQVRF